MSAIKMGYREWSKGAGKMGTRNRGMGKCDKKGNEKEVDRRLILRNFMRNGMGLVGVRVGISACRNLVATTIHYDTLSEFAFGNTVSCGTKVKDL